MTTSLSEEADMTTILVIIAALAGVTTGVLIGAMLCMGGDDE
jgi:hypothetical protein